MASEIYLKQKRANTQQGFGEMRGEILRLKCSAKNPALRQAPNR